MCNIKKGCVVDLDLDRSMSPSESCRDSLVENVDKKNIQGIILASNSTFNISFLTADRSKALLPINGNPLIWHSVKLLTDNEIKDIIVITEPKYKDAIETAIRDFMTKFSIKIISLDPEVSGSVEALKYIKSYITNDFLVIPCDLYGKVDISGLIKSHYQGNSGCTLLLYHNIKDTNNTYRCLSIIDDSTNKLISIVDLASFNVGNPLSIHKWHVFIYPNCKIRSDLIDLHVYMFSKALIPSDDIDCFSIRFHYIPFLTRTQEMSTSKRDSVSKTDKYTSVRYYIQSITGKDECLRINRPETFMRINLNYLTGKSFENVTIKGSNIASNVKFLGKASITKSVIMDNVTIGDNVVIKGCIICSGAIIGDNSQLNECQIQYSHKVEDGTVASKQTFPPTDYSL